MLLKEVFKFDGHTIAIVEAKEIVLNYLDLTEETVRKQHIDTRILTAIIVNTENVTFEDETLDVDYVICTYEYKKFDMNIGIDKAIIFHELGHIYHPPGSLGSEVQCDLYAMKRTSAKNVVDMLTLCISEMNKLNLDTEDLQTRKITIETFL